MRCHRTALAVLAGAVLALPSATHAMTLYQLRLLQGSVSEQSVSTESSASSVSSVVRPTARSRIVRVRPLPRRQSSSSAANTTSSISAESTSASSIGVIEQARRRRQALNQLSDDDIAELAIVERRINAERSTYGLPPLRRDRRLDIAAQMHAQDMLMRNYFDHASPEGELFPDRIRRAGYPENRPGPGCNCIVFIEYGENIALGQPTAERAVAAWMNSPSHRQNILEQGFSDVGYGKAGKYWVQDFGNVRVTVAPQPRS